MTHNIAIFIRGMPFFGDQLVTYPLLYQLRKLYPDSDITLIAQDPVEQYYQHLPWGITFIRADSRKAKYHAIPPDTKLVMALHHSSEQYALLSAAKRIPVRLSFKNKRVFDFLWTHTIKKDINDYIGLANLQLLNQLQPFDPVSAARGCMESIAAQKTRPVEHTDVVLMVGGGAGVFKRWGIPNYVSLADRLRQHMGQDTTFTFIAGPAEEAEIAEIKALNRPEFKLLIHRPVPEIADLCLNAKLIVANDCGPSHIAQNACVPYVGLFNEHNPEWFWNRNNSRAVVPPDNATDIQQITLEHVIQACLDVIDIVPHQPNVVTPAIVTSSEPEAEISPVSLAK